MTLQEIDAGMYAADGARKMLDGADAIAFDCDGVLVDVAESYDLTIMRTARHVLIETAQIPNPLDITPQIIEGFKATGGFNDEVDLTYAAALSIAAAHSRGVDPKEFVRGVIRNSDRSGIRSVEKYLPDDVPELKKELCYPGDGSPLRDVFDQIFYGPELYERLSGKKSQFAKAGLIENDRVLVDQELLGRLGERFGRRIAIVTGRGIDAARYPLGSILDGFDLSSSFFLDDEPRNMAKPSPEALIGAISGMDARCCIYVGDSMEDLMMTKAAAGDGRETVFCGIIGTSRDPQAKLRLFEGAGADVVLDSISLLPKVLNLV